MRIRNVAKTYEWEEMIRRSWSRQLAARHLGTDPEIKHGLLYSHTWDASLIDAIEARIGPELAAVIEKRVALGREERRVWERRREIGTIIDRIKGFKDEGRRAKLLATYTAKHGFTDEECREIESEIERYRRLKLEEERRAAERREREQYLRSCLETDGLLARGWPRTLISRFLGRPDAEEQFRVSGKGLLTRYLYEPDRVDRAEANPEWQAAKRKADRRRETRRPVDYAEVFAARYGDPTAALADACESMFLLNRHAKRLSRNNADQVYGLKNRFLEKLWTQGFCASASIHLSPTRDLECHSCEWTGESHFDDDLFDDESYLSEPGVCRRCYGTGIYRTRGGKPYWAFRFVVGDKGYSWHQPTHHTLWAEPVGDPRPDHEVLAVAKATKRFKITEAKALITWVVDSNTPND